MPDRREFYVGYLEKSPPGIAQLRKLIRKETNALDDIRASFPGSWFAMPATRGHDIFAAPNKLFSIGRCAHHKFV